MCRRRVYNKRTTEQVIMVKLMGIDLDKLAKLVIDLGAIKNLTIATAESCSGGKLGAALTSVAGSSAVYMGGVIAYDNAVKTGLLGVSADLIAKNGAVSEPVARAMAEGIRTRLGTSYGISITGIAGPGGGSPEKPVGTVFLAVASEHVVFCERQVFVGTREEVRSQSVARALQMLGSVLDP